VLFIPSKYSESNESLFRKASDAATIENDLLDRLELTQKDLLRLTYLGQLLPVLSVAEKRLPLANFFDCNQFLLTIAVLGKPIGAPTAIVGQKEPSHGGRKSQATTWNWQGVEGWDPSDGRNDKIN